MKNVPRGTFLFYEVKCMKAPDLRGISLDSLQRKKLEIYAKELRFFNKSLPLYSRRQKKDFCWEMILDSILAGQILLKDNFQPVIADIGSGAGFPGIVLAVLDPEREFWLFEPNKKKAGFLEYICWKMDLKNIQIKNQRVQEEKTLLNCAVSKALLSLGQRLALTQSVFRSGACYYHLQSLNWKKQWREAPLNVQESWSITVVQQYSYPSLFSDRVLLRTDFKKKKG